MKNEIQMYEPISDEELWGVPPADLPETDPRRNYFDENQAVIEEQIAAENDEGLLINDY